MTLSPNRLSFVYKGLSLLRQVIGEMRGDWRSIETQHGGRDGVQSGVILRRFRGAGQGGTPHPSRNDKRTSNSPSAKISKPKPICSAGLHLQKFKILDPTPLLRLNPAPPHPPKNIKFQNEQSTIQTQNDAGAGRGTDRSSTHQHAHWSS